MLYNTAADVPVFIRLEVIHVAAKGMPMDFHDLHARYVSGEIALREAARILGVSPPAMIARIKKAGLPLKKEVDDAARAECVRLFLSGESVNAVAEEVGRSRNFVVTSLRQEGIQARGQSEAEALKWSKMTDEQRAQQVAKAHAATRARSAESFAQARIKSAKTKARTKSKIGFGEQEMIDALVGRISPITPQRPIRDYNIDIMAGPIAVEVHVNPAHPHGSNGYFRERVEYLLGRGIDVLYIKFSKRAARFLPDECADQVVAFADFRRSNPSAQAQYRMIWCDGKAAFIGQLECDRLSVMPVPSGGFDAASLDHRVA